jgi:hypothetical protein
MSLGSVNQLNNERNKNLSATGKVQFFRREHSQTCRT